MSHTPLHNYLKAHRKEAALSQDEVASLLGVAGGDKISRHERRARVPNLETALAYEALFGVPVRELYAGVYQKVERETRRRARALVRKLALEAEENPDPALLHKLAHIRQVAELADQDEHEQEQEQA